MKMTIESVRKIVFVGLIVGIVILTTLLLWQTIFKPTAEEAFGKLTPVKLDTIVSDKVKVSSTVRLRRTPDVGSIFKVYRPVEKITQDKIVKILKFKGKPRLVSGRQLWESEDKSLLFTEDKKNFSYLDPVKVEAGELDQDQLIDKATKSLNGLGLITSGEYARVTNTEKIFSEKGVNIYSVSFGMIVDSFSVVTESGNTDLVSIRIGGDGTIKAIHAGLQPLSIRENSTYNSRPLKEAEEDLKNNNVAIVNLEGSLEVSDELKLSINYSQSKIAYLFTEKTDFLQPVYVFEGVASSSSKAFQTFSVTSMTPALAKK